VFGEGKGHDSLLRVKPKKGELGEEGREKASCEGEKSCCGIEEMAPNLSKMKREEKRHM